MLQQGDKIHITASHQELEAFFKAIGKRILKVKKVLIGGGGHVCFYLALQLLQAGMQVKIIERDEKRCEQLCEILPKATIIHWRRGR